MMGMHVFDVRLAVGHGAWCRVGMRIAAGPVPHSTPVLEPSWDVPFLGVLAWTCDACLPVEVHRGDREDSKPG